MWIKLKSTYTKVGQGIVYLIFQELFYYLAITQLKEYEKPMIKIFVKMKYFFKWLWLAMILNRNLWNKIAIVIILDSLYEDFDTITVSLLEIGNKTIYQIQNTLKSKEAKNLSKRAIEAIRNLAIAFYNHNRNGKRKANTGTNAITVTNLTILVKTILIRTKDWIKYNTPVGIVSQKVDCKRLITETTKNYACSFEGNCGCKTKLSKLLKTTMTSTPNFSSLGLLEPYL